MGVQVQKFELTAEDKSAAAFASIKARAIDLAGSLGVTLGAGAFLALAKGSIDAADHINDLSKSTGLAVETLAGLRLASRQSGADLDGVAASINKLSTNIGKDAEKFAALGVSAKSPIEAFRQLADVYSNLEDPQLRAAVAAAALGKSWAGAAPLLSEGSAKIQEMIDRGTRAAGITKELAEQADKFNDNLLALTSTGGGLTRMIGPLLPLMNMLLQDLADAKDGTDKLNSSTSVLRITFETIVVLGANVAFVFRQIGIGALAAQEQIAGFAKGGVKGFLEARAMMQGILDGERKALADWEKKVMGASSAAANSVKRLSEEEQVAAANAQSRRAATARAAAEAFMAHEKNKAARAAAAKAEENAYRGVMTAIAEKNAVMQREIDGEEKLSDAQKEALKLMVNLATGKLILTDAHKREMVAEMEGMLVRDQSLRSRKAVRDSIDAQLKASEALQEEQVRRNQVVADFNKTTAQTLEDLKFETQLLAVEAQLNGAGLLTRENEIRLIGEVNAQREILIGLRKIEADYQAALLAAADKEGTVNDEVAASLLRLAEARKAALPDAIAARESLKVSNELSRNSVNVFNTMWGAVENTGRSVFEYLMGTGTSTFQSIGKALKASVVDVLWQIVARPWVVQIGTAAAGSLGIGSVANAAGSAGSLLNAASGASSLSKLFSGGGTLGAVGAGYSSVAGTVAAEGAMYAAAGTVAEGVGAGLMAGLSAMGPLGWAALGVGALFGAKSLFGGGDKRKPSELAIRGLADGKLELSPVNVNGAGNVDAHNPAYDQAAAFLNSLPADTRAKLIGKSVTTGPSDSAEAMIAALFESQKEIIASGQAAAEALKAAGEAAAQFAEQFELARDAVINAVEEQIRATQSAANDVKKLADAFRQIAANLADTRVKLRGGDLSPLTPAQQLAESRDTLNKVFSAALGGDQAALSKLPDVATEFLNASRSFNASSVGYAQDFEIVMAMLDQAQSVSVVIADVQDQIAALLTHQVDILGLIKDEVSKPHPDPEVLATLQSQLLNDQAQAVMLKGTLDTQLANLRATFDAALAINTASLRAVGADTIASLEAGTSASVIEQRLAAAAQAAALGIATTSTISALFAGTKLNADTITGALGLRTSDTIGAIGAGASGTKGAVESSATALSGVIKATNEAIAESVRLTGVSAKGAAESQTSALLNQIGAGTVILSGLLQKLIDLAQTQRDELLRASAVSEFNSAKAVSDQLRDAQLSFVRSAGGDVTAGPEGVVGEDITRGIAQWVWYYLDQNAPQVEAMGQAYSNAFERAYALYKAIPGHADGLPWVPHDGYLMRAHEGEGVVDRDSMAALRRYGIGPAGGDRETQQEIAQLRREVAEMTIALRSGFKAQTQATVDGFDQTTTKLREVRTEISASR